MSSSSLDSVEILPSRASHPGATIISLWMVSIKFSFRTAFLNDSNSKSVLAASSAAKALLRFGKACSEPI